MCYILTGLTYFYYTKTTFRARHYHSIRFIRNSLVVSVAKHEDVRTDRHAITYVKFISCEECIKRYALGAPRATTNHRVCRYSDDLESHYHSSE